MTTFFTSDFHIGHTNVLKFDSRPFNSMEEMNEELIRRWNNKVKSGDMVYCLGDMFWKGACESICTGYFKTSQWTSNIDKRKSRQVASQCRK